MSTARFFIKSFHIRLEIHSYNFDLFIHMLCLSNHSSINLFMYLYISSYIVSKFIAYMLFSIIRLTITGHKLYAQKNGNLPRKKRILAQYLGFKRISLLSLYSTELCTSVTF